MPAFLRGLHHKLTPVDCPPRISCTHLRNLRPPPPSYSTYHKANKTRDSAN